MKRLKFWINIDYRISSIGASLSFRHFKSLGIVYLRFFILFYVFNIQMDFKNKQKYNTNNSIK